MAERQAELHGAELVVVEDAATLARDAAQRLTTVLAAAIDERGEAHLALTGGSSAGTLYRELAENWRDAVDWSRVHLWWGDERFVPNDHPESNVGLAYATLLQISVRGGTSGTGSVGRDVDADAATAVGVRPENVHPPEIDEAMSESDAADLVAQRYAEALHRLLPADADGGPAFDVILLGVGDDGHILSVFPGSPALAPGAPTVLAIPAPEHIGPHLPRVTLNPVLLGAARQVIVMVPGSGKAEIVERILRDRDADTTELPSRLALRPNAVWLLDRAAAERLGAG